MRFSRKAIDESKRKTGHLEAEAAELQAATESADAPQSSGTQPLDKYVNDMNQEISRMSDAVGNRLENLGGRLSRSFGRLVKPLGKSVNNVADSTAEGLKNMGDGIGKAMLQEFTTVVKNIGDKVGSKNPAVTPNSTLETDPIPSNDLLDQSDAPQHLPIGPLNPAPAISNTLKNQLPALTSAQNLAPLDWHFGKVLEKKIFFSTIHNRPFLTERDIQNYHPEDLDLHHTWMLRGIEEIKNCAPYGQKLPSPGKGRYMNIPMQDILQTVNLDDMQFFLKFVYHRPQPFQTKALKLSEAFATWAHKGAPDQ